MTVKIGASRIVFLCGNYAIKIARMDRYRAFLYGILANHQESTFYRAYKHEKLCPVVRLPYVLLGYAVIVMRRAKPLTGAEFRKLRYMSFVNEDDFCIPAENKIDSFGKYNDKIVAVDYGDK